jgi:hypothetical protein
LVPNLQFWSHLVLIGSRLWSGWSRAILNIGILHQVSEAVKALHKNLLIKCLRA